MTPAGRPEARRGSSGAVTALSTLAQSVEFTWVASAMGEGDRATAKSSEGRKLRSPLPGHKINLRYVVSPRRTYHKYYNIFCNPLLWFLHHYMWNPPYNPNVDASVHDAWQTGYVPVNQAFAQAVVEEARQGPLPPMVMGHDYHLYLAPGYVREEIPQAIIQHYVHVPWPAARYWQMIPSYIVRQICRSLCAADLLGFQTPAGLRQLPGHRRAFSAGGGSRLQPRGGQPPGPQRRRQGVPHFHQRRGSAANSQFHQGPGIRKAAGGDVRRAHDHAHRQGRAQQEHHPGIQGVRTAAVAPSRTAGPG